MVKCKVIIKDIRYWKDNWGIALVFPLSMSEEMNTENPFVDNDGNFIIKGAMPKLIIGDIYQITANEIKDPEWGIQYDLIFMHQTADLNNKEEQKIFLSKILTDIQLDAVYQTLDNPFETIQKEDIEALTKVKGFGITTAGLLSRCGIGDTCPTDSVHHG